MTSWESLGGGLGSGPGVASWAAGRLDVVVQGTDAACWHKWFDGGWSDWESLGGGFSSELDAVSWGPGRIDVFGRGLDDACWHKWFDGGWSDWESLGGGFRSGISAASWAPGRLDLFGRGLDDACWHRWFDGGWSGWESLGGGFSSEIEAVSWGPGRIDLFGRGTDGACWHKWFDGGWSDWESLGGAFNSGICAASWGPGRLDLFGQGTDGACWHKGWEGSWSEWESLGGGFTSSLAATSWAPGRIDVLGRGLDNACWHAWYDGGAWFDSSPVVAMPVTTGVVRLPVFDVVKLQTLTLPVFDQAAGGVLGTAPTTDVRAVDGTAWRTLTGWTMPPADGSTATVLCRRSGLSIRVPAQGRSAKLLPFTDGSPAASLVYRDRGSGQQVATPMETAVDADAGTILCALPFDSAAAYGAMVNVLSDSASGVKLVLDYAHRYLVQKPAPPPPPPQGGGVQTPPIILRPRHPDRVVFKPGRPPIGDLLRDRLGRGATFAVPTALVAQPLLAQPLAAESLVAQPLAAVPREAVLRRITDLAPREEMSIARALRDPEAVSRLRLAGRDWKRVVVVPRRPAPGQPENTEATLASRFEVPTYRPITDLAVYPDQPRVAQSGWDQVPGRPADKPALHFKDSPRADVFYVLPTRFKLGFYRGGEPDGSEDLSPIRVTQYLDPQQRYRVKVTLVAVPYISDTDRTALAGYIRETVLQQMLPYVSLERRSGLAATFVSQWSAGSGADKEILPETITVTPEEVLPDRRLTLRFDMEAMHYGIFCALLGKGIRGRVVLREDEFSESIDVSLRLDDLVTNALTVESQGFGTPAPAADVPDDQLPEATVERTVTLRNTLAYPARVSLLQVACIDRGAVPGMIFDAEPLDLLTAERVLGTADDAGARFPVRPERIAVWNDTEVSVGTIKVDGGTPQDWLDRVTRDPSLQPQRYAVSVTPVVPSGADAALIRLRVLSAADGTLRQQQDILPAGSSTLTLELRLADLAAAGGAPLEFVLEYDCQYGDGRVSLPQRVGLSPTVASLPISVLAEKPTSVYRVEHGLPGATPEVVDGLARDAAADIIGQARTRGERWRVTARTA